MNLLWPIYIDNFAKLNKQKFEKCNEDQFFFYKENQNNEFAFNNPVKRKSFFSEYTNVFELMGTTLDASPSSEHETGYFNEIFEIKDSNTHNFEKSKRTSSVINSKLSKSIHKHQEIPVTHIDVPKSEDLFKYPWKTDNSKVFNEIDDALDSLFSKNCEKTEPKKYKFELSTRKDVVNKNILRIISRYFKNILITEFPHHKNTFKNAQALSNLLSEFCQRVFPDNSDTNLKYVLGAFWLAPKMKILEMDERVRIEVAQIHKALSKYTHKDLEVLYGIRNVTVIVGNFYANGIEYFRTEETVNKNVNIYCKALDVIKSNFILQGDSLSLSL